MGFSMIKWPNFPLLLEINIWTWLKFLSEKYNTPVTIGTIPADEFIGIAGKGYHAVWLMGIWQRSSQARAIACNLKPLRKEYNAALPGFSDADVVGSPYAIKAYRVDNRLGDEQQLIRLRQQLHEYNLKLILDFVPNHLAVDHEWMEEHPEFFVQGTEQDLLRVPRVYFSVPAGNETRIFAHGKAPYAQAWTDTVQLDYRKAIVRSVMIGCLKSIASLCDGVRCDMAMLLIKDLFLRTWPGKYEEPLTEFWAEAAKEVKKEYPAFLFIGEVYWDYEYRMQKLGFDFVYDKVLYDRVLGKNPRAVFDHLYGGTVGFQAKLVRFVENHDENRVAAAVTTEQGLAAATLVFTVPGMHMMHEGQTLGNRIRLPVQLGRRFPENQDIYIAAFYEKLLAAIRFPVFQEGHWELLQPCSSAPGNETFTNIIAFLWILQEQIRLIAVNLSPVPSQCFLPLGEYVFAGKTWLLEDQLCPVSYVRNGDVMVIQGLFLDMREFGYHLFVVKEA